MANEFDLKGLEELQRDLQKCITEYPDETDRAIRRFGRQWVKDCNDKMPEEYSTGKRPIPKSWKRTVRRKLGVATEIEIRNTSPHFHLVENGHRKFIRGKDTGGYVPGKHFAEQTREEWTEVYPEKVQEFVDDLLKENNL